MTSWKPISSAPRDGTRILGYEPIPASPDYAPRLDMAEHYGILTVVWDNSHKRWVQEPCEASEYEPDIRYVTHYQDLPAPPTDTHG